jgi:hypothetical protein
LSLLSCSLEAGSPAFTKAIIGEDDREPANDISFAPLIGRVSIGEISCTAFAVASDEIMTASHCLPADGNFDATTAKFIAADRASYGLTELLLLDARKDIAVLKTAQRFPSYFERAPLMGGSLMLVAFDPATGGLAADRSCEYEKTIESAGAIVHSCDSVPGESGAPLLQDGKVVGVHVGYKESLDRNIAFDLRRIDDDTVDMLSLELRKEGCHSRVHVRGGIRGHSRAHVRDCVPDVPSPGELINGIVSDIARKVSLDVAAQAERDGWNTTNCAVVGSGAILLPAATYIAPACAASGFITGGMGVPACVTTVSGAIVAATCTQLCTDRHLSDCK